MFSDQFINDQVHQLKDDIVLPESGFFVLTEAGLRLCHVINGVFYFIIIPSRKATAMYLVDNGHIDSFKEEGENIILYRHSFFYSLNHQGKQEMLTKHNPVAWEDVTLTKSDVKLLAARKECDRCLAGIPLEQAPKMFTPAKYNF